MRVSKPQPTRLEPVLTVPSTSLPVKFPKQRQEIAKHVVAMLQDKSSSVRRYAIALLTKLILTHPFGLLHGGPLNLTEWEGRYETVTKELKEMERTLGMGVPPDLEGSQAEQGEPQEEGEKEDDQEDQTEDEEDEDEDEAEAAEVAEAMEEDEGEEAEPAPKKEKKVKKAKTARSSLPVDLANVTDEQVLAAFDAEKHVKLKLIKKYVADALAFIRQVEGASGTLSQLLVSTSKAEVLESMEFFKTAHDYEMECAEIGITKMIHLIWTKDNSATSTEDGKELKGIRSKLVEVYRLLYFDPLPDLEPKQQINRIAKNMIERGAIIILGMIALAEPEVVSKKLETLLKVGLGRFGKADLVLARYTCIALQRLGGSVKKVKGSLTDKSIRFPMEHHLFRKLQDAIEHPSHSMDWFGMAEQAVNTIYLLGEQPDSLCTTLLRNFTVRVFAPKSKASAQDAADNSQAMDEDQDDPTGREDTQAPPSPSKTEATEQTNERGDLGDSFELSQLLFLVGHVAIKHIVHLELVERDLKRRKDEGAKEKHAKNSGKAIVEELDQIVGNAEDDIGDHIIDVREREMLYGPNSILATFGPMIDQDPTLRNAATLALSKLMCVSSRFCEENLLLLFKIFETSKDANIRGNIVITLGDIAVCFNNMIDENSDNLYRGLTDKDLNVKKNTLMVLTHLILNGMIKVKGQLGEMAKCLEDEDTRIADLAKLFFTELSTKDNAIYNNLPDVISHLSVGEHAVDEETFQSTMKYIFTFIEKEKQAESIVEKLCQRFRLTEEPRQWQDIAFCLSLLPYKSERSMKKLIEGLPFYQDKLHNEIVFTRFSEILAKARSNKSSNKPDSELKEFEAILQEHREKGEEDQNLEKTMKKKADQAKKRATRRGGRRQRATTHDEEAED
ncbi:Condensin complex subunit [Tulasnella sp. 427]|nr:Condensin complex subunit [Tulasnella sp. 427]